MNKELFMLDLMEIERELGHFLEQQEYGLVDLQVASTGRGRTFRVFVERAEGTPADLADCTHLSPMSRSSYNRLASSLTTVRWK